MLINGILRKKTVKILSIDGGGIRGLIPALILKEIENRLKQKKRFRPFSEVFDLIAGTSTGSIIALGLALPTKEKGAFLKTPALSIDDLIELYQKNGIKIFPRGTFNNLRYLVQAFKEKYDKKNLEAILENIFQDVTIKDALTNVIITSYDTERGSPFFFKKRPEKKEWRDDLNFFMRDAARASSAAPTFFEPAYISPIPNGRRYCLIDGGVFANNPAMCALAEARKIFHRVKKYILVSLGTGRSSRSYTYSAIRKWGFIDWVHPINSVPLSSIMSYGQSECVIHQLRNLPEVDFYRFNASLEEGNNEIDDASPENMGKLAQIAGKIIAEYNDSLNRLSRIL